MNLQEALSASEAKVTELQVQMDQVKSRSLQVRHCVGPGASHCLFDRQMCFLVSVIWV